MLCFPLSFIRSNVVFSASLLVIIGLTSHSLVFATPKGEEGEQPTAKVLESAEVLLGRIQSFYAKATDFKADFKQTYTYQIYGRQKISTGKVYFKKPSRMRWDYETPNRRIFVADGSTLWVYEPDEAQVFKRDLASAQLPVALRFMKGEGELTTDFEVDQIRKGTQEDEMSITLKPRVASPDFTQLTLVIKKAVGEVVASVLVDPTENTNRIDFVDVQVNQNLPESGFSFSPPKGVRVINESTLN